MLGKSINIDIKDQFINQLTSRVLNKYYDYDGEFWISTGTKQIVSGINYNLNVDLHDLNKTVILRFTHKAWGTEHDEITLLT